MCQFTQTEKLFQFYALHEMFFCYTKFDVNEKDQYIGIQNYNISIITDRTPP